MTESDSWSDSAQCLAGLNREQLEAVNHLGSPLFVVAGPGSGKTRVISRRMAHRIASGIPAHRILGVTFTQRAAREMKSRLHAESTLAARAHVGTFHWVCQALLRRHAGYAGYQTGFRLLSPGEARRIQQTLATAAALPRGQMIAAAAAVKSGLDLREAARRHSVLERDLAGFLAIYDDRLRALGALDLDDLVRVTVSILREHRDVRAQCQARFDEIMVDEYQDTSPLQQELLSLLLPESKCLAVVGDEDQAIYGWRQATNTGFEVFQQRFPDARIITLHETYRSSKLIVRMASALISHNRHRAAKNLTTANEAGELPVCYAALDGRDEAEWIAGEVGEMLERGNMSAGDIGVLYRTNVQARAIEDALVSAGIQYQVFAGRRFYQRDDVRAVVAFIRLALDASDKQAAAFLLGLIPGIGAKRLELLIEGGSASEFSYREDLIRNDLPLPANVRRRVVLLATAIQNVEAHRYDRLPALAAAAVLAAGTLLGAESVEDAGFGTLDELRSVIDELSGRRGTAREFVDRISLGESEGSEEGVNLLSLHAAKGLEFTVVFLAGLEEGLLPHRRALDCEREIEEERRLCYVGVTRARRRLYMSYAQSRMLAGQALSGSRSRFVTEMGKSNVTIKTSPLLVSKAHLASVRVGALVQHPPRHAGTVNQVEEDTSDMARD